MKEINSIIQKHNGRLKKLRPSVFAETFRKMPHGSPIPGAYSFKNAPYCREIADRFSADDPTKYISIIKVPQSGLSVALVENCLCWSISESPGNWMILSGDDTLSKEMVKKRIEPAIDSCGLRHKIKSSSQRARNQNTGDTNKSKEFYGGSVIFGGPNNPNMYRQHTTRYGILDDFDAAKRELAVDGDLRNLWLKRFTWHQNDMKACFISTPTISGFSNIESTFNLSDKREYKVPCPCCGSFIVLEFKKDIEKERFGLIFKHDRFNKVLPDSVHYRCYECGDVFTERSKYEMLNNGVWMPTNEEAAEDYHAGYHIGGLILPIGTIGWQQQAQEFLNCYPNGLGQAVDPAKLKVFVNMVEGRCYTPEKQDVKSTQLQKNTREYKAGTIPSQLSRQDGNGEIVLLSFVSDINGTEDDCRMDWEIIADTETQSNYSIMHGSIGSFERRKERENKTAMSVRTNDRNSIWPEVAKILSTGYATDDGRTMYIMAGAIDEGFGAVYVQSFIKTLQEGLFFMFKGQGLMKTIAQDRDLPLSIPSKSNARRQNVYVNVVKDVLYPRIKLIWDRSSSQPDFFMNYPKPEKGMYTHKDYFEQYEGEHKVVTTSSNHELCYIWEKKTSDSPNHFWDCRVYHLALADLQMKKVCKEYKTEATWMNFSAIMKKLLYNI